MQSPKFSPGGVPPLPVPAERIDGHGDMYVIERDDVDSELLKESFDQPWSAATEPRAHDDARLDDGRRRDRDGVGLGDRCNERFVSVFGKDDGENGGRGDDHTPSGP
jgi:hypothetical protein